jgi:hypothetical protein
MLVVEVAGMPTILFYAAGKKACFIGDGAIDFLPFFLI